MYEGISFIKLLSQRIWKRTEKIASGLHSILRRFILVLVTAVVISCIVVTSTGKRYKTETALQTKCSDSLTFKGVFIRNERVVTYSGAGVVSYKVVDGGRLGLGSVIAEIYSNDEQILLKQQIASMKKELERLKKNKNPGTTESAQPLGLSALINENYRNAINQRENGDFVLLSDTKEALLVSLSTYRCITDSTADFESKILELEAKIAQLEVSQALPIDTKYADSPAYFVSYTDGYEGILTKARVSDISISELNAVADRKIKTDTVIGKIIDNYDWYLMGVVDNSGKKYNIGDTVKLKFETAPDAFTARIIDLRDEGNPAQTVLTVWCEEFNYNLVQHRTQPVEIINGEYEGLKVPRSALRFKNFDEEVSDTEGFTTVETVPYMGVYVVEGNKLIFKKINKVFESSNFVLSKTTRDTSYLSLYDEIAVEGVDANETN